MALGSACIPIPSEVVMLFAGFAVADPGQSGAHHHLTMVGIVLAGLLGTMVGSWIAYGGRARRAPGAARTPRLTGCTWAQRRSSAPTAGSQRYGEPAVLFGRMIPLVRAFVSLPAGVAKMPFGRFTVLSLIGSHPLGARRWRSPGDALGSDWTSVRKGFEYVDYAVVVLVVVGDRLRGRAPPARAGATRRAAAAAGGMSAPLPLRHAVALGLLPRARPSCCRSPPRRTRR